jgi:hypothetical protein
MDHLVFTAMSTTCWSLLNVIQKECRKLMISNGTNLWENISSDIDERMCTYLQKKGTRWLSLLMLFNMKLCRYSLALTRVDDPSHSWLSRM